MVLRSSVIRLHDTDVFAIHGTYTMMEVPSGAETLATARQPSGESGMATRSPYSETIASTTSGMNIYVVLDVIRNAKAGVV